MRTVFGTKTVVAAVLSPFSSFVLSVSEDLRDHATNLKVLQNMGIAWFSEDALKGLTPGVYRLQLKDEGLKFALSGHCKVMDL